MIAGTGITPCATCGQPFPPASAVPPVVDKALLDAATKPPTQIAGVAGIVEVPITMHQAPADVGINWRFVASLPPFQMFLSERAGPNQTGQNSHAWATMAAIGLAADVGDKALLDQYAAWHEAKGYWPDETPLGRSKG